jgi:hypothetical protein
MMYKITNESVAITKKDRLEPPLRQSGICTPHLSLSLLVGLNKDKTCYFPLQYLTNQLPQPLVFSGSAAFSSIKYCMKPVNSFNLLQLSYATSDIIFKFCFCLGYNFPTERSC